MPLFNRRQQDDNEDYDDEDDFVHVNASEEIFDTAAEVLLTNEKDDEQYDHQNEGGTSIVEKDENVNWEGHLVSRSYVGIFSEIKSDHPETFEYAKFSTVAVGTLAYNFLGHFLTSLAEKSLVDLELEDISYFKDVLADLEKFNFNIEWLRKHVDKIEEVKFMSPLVGELDELKMQIGEKTKELMKVEVELEELQRLLLEKIVEIKDVHMGLGVEIETMCLNEGFLSKKRRLCKTDTSDSPKGPSLV